MSQPRLEEAAEPKNQALHNIDSSTVLQPMLTPCSLLPNNLLLIKDWGRWLLRNSRDGMKSVVNGIHENMRSFGGCERQLFRGFSSIEVKSTRHQFLFWL